MKQGKRENIGNKGERRTNSKRKNKGKRENKENSKNSKKPNVKE